MARNKISAKVIGVMYLLGFSGVVTASITKPIFESKNFLELIYVNQSLIQVSILFNLIMAIACIFIGILFYPILKKYNEQLAFGGAMFRLLEGFLYFFGMIIILSLISLSGNYMSSESINLGKLLLILSSHTNKIFILLSWCIGALMQYIVLHRSTLIPKWLTIWGIIGVLLCILSSLLVLFQIVKPMSSLQIGFNLPIGLQELVLAIWLIVKGFNNG